MGPILLRCLALKGAQLLVEGIYVLTRINPYIQVWVPKLWAINCCCWSLENFSKFFLPFTCKLFQFLQKCFFPNVSFYFNSPRGGWTNWAFVSYKCVPSGLIQRPLESGKVIPLTLMGFGSGSLLQLVRNFLTFFSFTPKLFVEMYQLWLNFHGEDFSVTGLYFWSNQNESNTTPE